MVKLKDVQNPVASKNTVPGGSSLKNRVILITGVSGMMGRALAQSLAADNVVYGMARFSDSSVKSRLEKQGVRCIVTDFASRNLPGLPENTDVLLHFAVEFGSNPPERAMDINGYLIGRLIERLPQLKCFAVGSTVSVYFGGGKRYDITEAFPTIPSGLYGASKLAGDIVATHLARSRGLPGVILRYWFPYSDEPGGSNYYQGLVEWLQKRQPFVLPPGIAGCQQPLFIADLVRITIASLRFAGPDPFIINVAGPERLTLREIVKTLGEVFEIEPIIQESDGKTNLITGSFDLTRLAQTCGLGTVNFRQGLERLKSCLHNR